MRPLIFLILLFVAPTAWMQNKELPNSQATVKDFIGIWEAFQEGDLPDKSKGEEPSKLAIWQDGNNRIIVFLATRYADRQIRFRYGVARVNKGVLFFTDERGFAFKITIGRNADYDRFLGVKPDIPDAESEVGSFRKVDIR